MGIPNKFDDMVIGDRIVIKADMDVDKASMEPVIKVGVFLDGKLHSGYQFKNEKEYQDFIDLNKKLAKEL